MVVTTEPQHRTWQVHLDGLVAVLRRKHDKIPSASPVVAAFELEDKNSITAISSVFMVSSSPADRPSCVHFEHQYNPSAGVDRANERFS